MPDDDPTIALEDALGYHFDRRALLLDALTHRSYANERPDLAPRDNERMEFLGDAILGVAASALLWLQFPEASEGELSRRRADLVCERSLAAIAQDLCVGPLLRLGRGEEKSGGRDKPRLLASALEAIIAAVYLDAGEREAISIGRALLAPHVAAQAPGSLDFKSRLQELFQASGRPPPTYTLESVEGPDHDRRFFVVAREDGEVIGRGEGRSKLRAEQAAARDALEAPEREADDPTTS